MGKNLPDHSEPVLTAMASHGLYTDGCDLVRWVFHCLSALPVLKL